MDTCRPYLSSVTSLPCILYFTEYHYFAVHFDNFVDSYIFASVFFLNCTECELFWACSDPLGSATALPERPEWHRTQQLHGAEQTAGYFHGAAKTELHTGFWLPAGNRVSRAPPRNRLTEQKIPNLFEFFEFKLLNAVK